MEEKKKARRQQKEEKENANKTTKEKAEPVTADEQLCRFVKDIGQRTLREKASLEVS